MDKISSKRSKISNIGKKTLNSDIKNMLDTGTDNQDELYSNNGNNKTENFENHNLLVDAEAPEV